MKLNKFWRSVLGVLWREWCWGWNSSTLATSCEELAHWKRLWCWEGLGAGGEGDDRGWDGWMASLTRWMWVWVNSRTRWWTGRPGVLQFMGSQRVGHDWATELNWRSLSKWWGLNSGRDLNQSGCFALTLCCFPELMPDATEKSIVFLEPHILGSNMTSIISYTVNHWDLHYCNFSREFHGKTIERERKAIKLYCIVL